MRDAARLVRRDVDSPVGRLTLLASDHGLRALLWSAEWAEHLGIGVPEFGAHVSDTANDHLDQAVLELSEYFAGHRKEFTVTLDPVGTPFQLSAWQALRAIPYGETISYGEQARRLGDPRKSRAVGAANGQNPISIIVPCHRVVGGDGKLTGFGGGLPAKAWLLDHELSHRFDP